MSSKTESGVKMFLDPESDPFKQIFTPELKTLSHLFIKYGYELRIAGGAVRYFSNALSSKLNLCCFFN